MAGQAAALWGFGHAQLVSSKTISGVGIQTTSAPKKGPGLQQPTMLRQPGPKRRRAAHRADSQSPTSTLHFREMGL